MVNREKVEGREKKAGRLRLTHLKALAEPEEDTDDVGDNHHPAYIWR